MAFYYLRTFGHSQSGQKRLRSRFIAAADCDYRDDIRGCHSPKRDDVQVDHEIPSRVNSHLAGFVSKCEAAPIYEELLGAASD